MEDDDFAADCREGDPDDDPADFFGGKTLRLEGQGGKLQFLSSAGRLVPAHCLVDGFIMEDL